MDIMETYKEWCKKATKDKDIAEELASMSGDEQRIEDSFYRDLAFGTGGLRGVIGAGTNRMNIYTVGKASQGLAEYLNANYEKASIVIGYDSRIKSDLFARHAASVFASNGIHVYIWRELLPVPTVSYATRYLQASAGVMITASHNPSKYNGYKVYGNDGCQITTNAAEEILNYIDGVDIFDGVRFDDFDEMLKNETISYISDEVLTKFIEEVKSQSVLYGQKVNKDLAIVYSPLNGTGLKPVTRTLKEMGYTNITIVEEQKNPDGTFPTCPYPNPEIKEAMALGLEYAKKLGADLLLATDPDCDRVGIAVRDNKGMRASKGEYVLLSGNETGILLLDYICSRRIATGNMPKEPVMIKTIVTSDMASQLAVDYGIKVIDCLTGFKYIGEQIGFMEAEGRDNNFIFGMEESYGYLTGGYVRDKDAVDGAFMICEMFAYYASQGMGLVEKLYELYRKYGYRLNTLHSYEFDGASGNEKMQRIMKSFRGGIRSIAGYQIEKLIDYSLGIDGLPKSDVLKFLLSGNGSVVVRPSGTEPKLKIYISVVADDFLNADKKEKEIISDLERLLDI